MSALIEHIGSLASFIGSLTVVGGALMWVYNKFISAPREKKRRREAEEHQKRMIELITKKNEPLNQSIEHLNELLSESQMDRKRLNHIAENNTKMLKNHEERLDGHNERLIVLEVKNGVRKVTYQEGNEE